MQRQQVGGTLLQGWVAEPPSSRPLCALPALESALHERDSTRCWHDPWQQHCHSDTQLTLDGGDPWDSPMVYRWTKGNPHPQEPEDGTGSSKPQGTSLIHCSESRGHPGRKVVMGAMLIKGQWETDTDKGQSALVLCWVGWRWTAVPCKAAFSRDREQFTPNPTHASRTLCRGLL